MQVRGALDCCDEQLIEGWITDHDSPELRIALEIHAGDRLLGTCVADRFRQDLADAGIADGRCAFSFPTPPHTSRQELREVRFRLAESDLFFHPPSRSFSPAPPHDAPSQFGSLWIDRSDFMDQVARKHRLGQISAPVEQALYQFVRDGRVVLPRAVPAAIVRAVNAELDGLWRAPPPGLLMESFEPDGHRRRMAPDARHRNGRAALLDPYRHSAAVREALAAPAVTAFLRAVFEDVPKLFQCEAFRMAPQRPMHKDTAYVQVDTNPLSLVTAWVALEDVQPGAGEVECYLGSHRAPDFLFGGSSKWMEGHTRDHDQFLRSIYADAERFKHTRESFLARAGDVLIGHADLAHGDATATQPRRTRRSLVAHFTAASDEPLYRRLSRHAALSAADCVFVSRHGDMVAA